MYHWVWYNNNWVLAQKGEDGRMVLFVNVISVPMNMLVVGPKFDIQPKPSALPIFPSIAPIQRID